MDTLDLFGSFTPKEIEVLIELGKTSPRIEGLRRYWDNISPEEYQKRGEASSQRNRDRWANMSVEEYRKECEKISKRKKKWWDSLTPEEYLEMSLKNSRGQLRYWASLSRGERDVLVGQFVERIQRERDSLTPEEKRERYSEVGRKVKEAWDILSEDEKAERLRTSFLKGGQVQTLPEKIVEVWLEQNRSGEWLYNGANKEVIIGGRSPDFINIDGKKEVIEVFGMYWHSDDEEEQRISHYKKYGFDCKVIWEWDCNPVEIEKILVKDGIPNG